MYRTEMLPAGHGDCLLIEYGESADIHRVLIDTGPFYVFNKIASRIHKIADSMQKLELFVITHVDTDHIDGAVKLLGAYPSDFMQDVWFNGWDQISKVMRGPVQGEMLGAELDRDGLPWNVAFKGKAVSVEQGQELPVKPLKGGLTITLMSPELKELGDLKQVWETTVLEAGLKPGSHSDALKKMSSSPRYRTRRGSISITELAGQPFKENSTPSNASSIAFLAEYAGKTCLFAADAQPYRLADSIKRLLVKKGTPKLKVDVMKLSHHGSSGNTSPELLNLLDCKHFMISTNGGGGFDPPHPHAETIARVIQGCGPDVELWFNYRNDLTNLWDNPSLMKQYRYKAHYPGNGQEGLVVPLSEL
jgi:beta-lactamase superfamily II metal-dependent hydrolase